MAHFSKFWLCGLRKAAEDNKANKYMSFCYFPNVYMDVVIQTVSSVHKSNGKLFHFNLHITPHIRWKQDMISTTLSWTKKKISNPLDAFVFGWKVLQPFRDPLEHWHGEHTRRYIFESYLRLHTSISRAISSFMFILCTHNTCQNGFQMLKCSGLNMPVAKITS